MSLTQELTGRVRWHLPKLVSTIHNLGMTKTPLFTYTKLYPALPI